MSTMASEVKSKM